MLIRKLFKFEAAHIVRNAVSERCKYSIHGHSYKVEVCLKGKVNPETGMVMDFIEFKNAGITDFLDKLDHSTIVWGEDSNEYINDIQKHSKRIVYMSHNPTAENMAITFHYEIQKLLNQYNKDIKVKYVRVHETETGYAESEESDILENNLYRISFKHN